MNQCQMPVSRAVKSSKACKRNEGESLQSWNPEESTKELSRLSFNTPSESNNEKSESGVPDAVQADPEYQGVKTRGVLQVESRKRSTEGDSSRCSFKHASESNNEKNESVPDAVQADPSYQGMQENEEGIPHKVRSGKESTKDSSFLKAQTRKQKYNNEEEEWNQYRCRSSGSKSSIHAKENEGESLQETPRDNFEQTKDECSDVTLPGLSKCKRLHPEVLQLNRYIDTDTVQPFRTKERAPP
ncbi:hypothetical protein AVEN_135452-1 [Araneus ventricosus]|uniref:Uncharacterized protein n=1 Tax=Araneus ventricosus TaxID=182803 RepID=A0A4Y2BG25_ARAVE|nr:hypothetical protein AVEN_135452-1 [Araneus ventricosus]